MLNIDITNIAQDHIKACLEKRGHGIGITIRLKKSGCNGYSYVVEFADIQQPEFEYANCDDIMIGIDKQEYLLSNLSIDYETTKLNSGLKIKNPNEKSQCGCGQSFEI